MDKNKLGQEVFAMVSVPTGITSERIIDLICCAFEGGINYWAMVKSKKKPKIKCPYKTTVMHESWEGYSYWYPLVDGGSIQLVNDEGEKCLPLNKETINKGLIIMANKYPWHFDNFIKENEDAETADVFIQCCVFGEIVFG